MSRKTVMFKLPARPAAKSADVWVAEGGKAAAEAPPEEPMKRFTIDVPLELHTRIKTQCAMRGTQMAAVIRQILEREFPKS